MLKKIMKAALAASLVFGMSSFAYAQDFSVGGKFREYFGQYNSGAEDYTAHFESYGEANLYAKGKIGKVSVYHELESKGSTDFNNTQTRLSYALGFGVLTLGNQINPALVIPFSVGAGFSTSNIPGDTAAALPVAGYTENEGLGLMVPLSGMGAIFVNIYEQSAGTNNQVGADLKFGSIGVRVGVGSSKADDPADPDDESDAVSTNHVGVKVGLGDSMDIVFDIANKDDGSDAKQSAMSLGVNMKQIGPGMLKVRYDQWVVKDTWTKTKPSVVFIVPLGKGAQMEAGYIATTTTPEVGDATTESFLGAGLAAAF